MEDLFKKLDSPLPDTSYVDNQKGIIMEKFLNVKMLSIYNQDYTLNSNQEDSSIDLIRVYKKDPSKAEIEEYKKIGFVYKPSWILWLMYLKNNDYMKSIKSKEKNAINKALREIQNNNEYYVLIKENLERNQLDDFYKLYNKGLTRIKRAVNVAKSDYQIFLDNLDRFTGIFIYYQSQLIGGLLSKKNDENSMLRAVYLSVDKSHHFIDVTRILYYYHVQTSINLGYDIASLGADPSFYGHVASLGLFHIKKIMGFIPFPAKIYEDGGPDYFEKVVSLKNFDDPVLSVSYDEYNQSKFNGYIYYNNRNFNKKIIDAKFFNELIEKKVEY
ncbi:hypothetical protein TEPIDINF_002420 [Tepidibacillus infernus]|uniref:hypothetical protein n=1 Tax=Tepidibacillus infernus TaxID=1806172 RepID=UPI003B6F4B8A